MKSSMTFALGLLATGLAPTAVAQDMTAEKLFRDTENKIREAKAIEIVFIFENLGKTAKGSVLLSTDDKVRLRASGHYYPGIKENPSFELASDGRRFKTKGAALSVASDGVPYFDRDGKATEGDTGKGFSALSSVILTRGGVGYFVYCLPIWIHGTGGADPKQDLPASNLIVHDFRAGAAEKIGERQAKIVRYKWGNGDNGEVTLWIDAKSGLPLKRVFNNTEGVFVGRFTETYSEFNLNPNIDNKAFDLPK